jgi:predicted AlkP superfamily pyrophosphatase or phosphodiesterase
VIHIVIIAAFLALLYGAYKATRGSSTSKSASIARTLSNGTHTFAPTTILLSLDGFRADFLTRGLTPTLNSFIRSGVSPKYMLPAFPSLTFPNHFTLVTGLHPESHGVVGNTFWDPNTQKEFYYTDPDRSMQPEWWNAEPLWLTAELQGVRSAIHMWPGSEAHIGSMEPEFVDEFNADEELKNKVNRILHWLDLPGDDDENEQSKERRPQLIAAYTPNVDADGHKYGPNSTYIRSTIAEVDGMLANLFKGIDQRNLTNIVNIIVVSDHGMATTSTSRLVQLEDIIDTNLIEHTDGWPLYGLRPYKNDEAHIVELYSQLYAKSKLPKYKDAFDVYMRDKNMPAKYHFTKNDRIAPLWIMPRAGWAIVTKDEFDVKAAKNNDDVYHPRGLHGYDHQHPLMRAIFVARGPAFPHPEGSRVQEFQNTEVYNIVCDSLGLEPKPNNGTIRLPFKTKGQHDFSSEPEVPEDLPSDDDLPPEVPNLNNDLNFPTQVQPDHGPTATATKLGPIEPFQPIPPDPPARPTQPGKEDGPKRPVVQDGEKTDPDDVEDWWGWVKGKVEEVKEWLEENFGKDKDGKGDKKGKDG